MENGSSINPESYNTSSNTDGVQEDTNQPTVFPSHFEYENNTDPCRQRGIVDVLGHDYSDQK